MTEFEKYLSSRPDDNTPTSERHEFWLAALEAGVKLTCTACYKKLPLIVGAHGGMFHRHENGSKNPCVAVHLHREIERMKNGK